MFEEKEETEMAVKSQLVGRKMGRVTKETTKKMKKGYKKNAIEIGKLEEEEKEEEEMSIIEWKDFEVYHLIAIRGDMDEEFTKTANKQGNLATVFSKNLPRLGIKPTSSPF